MVEFWFCAALSIASLIGSVGVWFVAYWLESINTNLRDINIYIHSISGWTCHEMAERDKIAQEMKHAASARELPKQEVDRRDGYSDAYLKREFGED